jgi:hypothetical protein
MYWITVSSTRDFGVRLVNTRRPQLWMTPFFPARANTQVDPSSKSFRLPFQNIDGNNHIAQWTEQIVAPLCSSVDVGGPGSSGPAAGDRLRPPILFAINYTDLADRGAGYLKWCSQPSSHVSY